MVILSIAKIVGYALADTDSGLKRISGGILRQTRALPCAGHRKTMVKIIEYSVQDPHLRPAWQGARLRIFYLR